MAVVGALAPRHRSPVAGPIGPSRPVLGRARLRQLPAHWPITLCIAGFPLWWALGLGALMWMICAVPLGIRLVARRRAITVPRGFGTWALFLVVVVLSASAFDSGAPPLGWLFRLAQYASCTIYFLAICGADDDEIAPQHLVRLLAGLWITTVVGGWLGVLVPAGSIPSLTEHLLPQALATDEFVRVLVRPEFSQIQTVLGYPLGRPKAPFLYANDWGSTFSLLLPFFFHAWLQARDPRRRSWAYLLLLVALVPVFLSLNRGMWLSLGIALVYGSSRTGEIARLARRALVALLTVGLLLIAFTPVGGIVEGRAENDHSSSGRSMLYGEALRLTADNPILGVGRPQPYQGNKIVPLIGTQGLLWNVMVSTGFLGLGLFLATWWRWIWETRAGPPTTFWCHVTLIVGAVQMFVYDMVPTSLHIVFIVAALGYRAATSTDPVQRGELAGAAA